MGFVAVLFAGLPTTKSAPQKAADWPTYGGNSDDNRYSALAQINRSNVSKLQVAWTYDSGETGGIETSPIVVGNVLYTYTPTAKVVALNASTGEVSVEVRFRSAGRQSCSRSYVLDRWQGRAAFSRAS